MHPDAHLRVPSRRSSSYSASATRASPSLSAMLAADSLPAHQDMRHERAATRRCGSKTDGNNPSSSELEGEVS
eukprot:5613487-Pleurochrysis_carterae.AAC.1